MPVKKVKSQKIKVKKSTEARRPTRSVRVVRSTKAKTSKKKTGKPSTARSLSTSVYNIKGKVVGKVALPKEIFGAEVNNKLMAQAVRVYLANQRLGTASSKSRGEVSLTTAKWYRQKGTGRARHGAKSAPIFVGGGVAFGPKPRDFSMKLSQNARRAALFSALSSKLSEGEIKVLTGLEKIEPKTQKAYEVVKKLNGKDAKILLITPKDGKLENVYRSFRNIEGMNILSSNVLNTYQVLNNKLILLMKDAVEGIKGTYLKS